MSSPCLRASPAWWCLTVLALLGASVAGAVDRLVFVDVKQDGVGGVHGLVGVVGMAVSPDGAHLYSAARADGAVAIFRRDPASGALTFLRAIRNGDGGTDGVGGAYAVAVSPDGAHVYVAGYDDDALAVFRRDPATGELVFVHAPKDGANGVDGLKGARSVAVSPDGRRAYVAGLKDDAVAVFLRDPATGMLAFVQALREGENAVGIAGIESVAVSPDGAHVYTASVPQNAVAVFHRLPGATASASSRGSRTTGTAWTAWTAPSPPR